MHEPDYVRELELELRRRELDARAHRLIVRSTIAIVSAEALLQNRDTSRRNPESN